MKSLPGIFLLFLTSCQMVKTVKTDQVLYADGRIKQIKQTVIRKNRDFELHGNFRKETRITKNYYYNGHLKTYWKVIYTNGADVSCYEDYYRFETYDSTGTKRTLLESSCDCMKKKEITWNAKGRLTKKEKTLIKRLD